MSKKRKKIISNKGFQKRVYIDPSPIFKFIKPNNNDQLSKLNGPDLQTLIILIDEYYLQLRSCLGFEEAITFGLELEAENAMKEKIDKQLYKNLPQSGWITKHDGSLHNGVEINSPILRDKETTWKNLYTVCSIVESHAAIDNNSGGHIHIGAQILGNNKEAWLNFLKLWAVYENIIFRFTYGNFLTARPSLLKYAKPIAQTLWQDLQELKKDNSSLERIIIKISHEKRQAVNFNNILDEHYDKLCDICDKNTIEFRCPNGSLNPVIWQNNVNLFVKLLTYSKSTSFNDDLVEQRYRANSDKFANLKLYDEIYLEQVLELCDMLFTNNLDKVYFLRQYLKSMQVCKQNNNKLPQARILTKKGIKTIN